MRITGALMLDILKYFLLRVEECQHFEHDQMAFKLSEVKQLVDRLQVADKHAKIQQESAERYMLQALNNGAAANAAEEKLGKLQSKLAELHTQKPAHYLRFESDGKTTFWPTQVADSEPLYKGPVVVEQEPYKWFNPKSKNSVISHESKMMNGSEFLYDDWSEPLYAKPVPAEQVTIPANLDALWQSCNADINKFAYEVLLHAGHYPEPSQVVAIPEGYCVMPIALTAENGAKGLLSGEFFEQAEMTCPECVDDCEDENCYICDGKLNYLQKVTVDWTTIKAIYKKSVDGLSINREVKL
jgi:hypothetical protein